MNVAGGNLDLRLLMTALYRVWVKQMPMSGDLSGVWAFSWDPYHRVPLGTTHHIITLQNSLYVSKSWPKRTSQNIQQSRPRDWSFVFIKIKFHFIAQLIMLNDDQKLYPVNITLPFHKFSGRIWWSILPQGTSLVHRLMWCMVQARALHSPILVSHELDLRGH